MKKLLFTLLYTILFSTTTVFAMEDVVVSLKIDNPIMYINGAQTEIDKGRGITPVITNGRTLVPIRAIIEAFGGSVGWDSATQTVTLNMSDDVINLTIDNYTAYLNNAAYALDVAPTIINSRTMLPIRFIAESFNLGVAWDNITNTVSIIRDSFTDEEYDALISVIPPYSGDAYVVINNNIPYFKNYEIIGGSFEYYSQLDMLGRCDVCVASISTDLMPTEERGNISSVKPTGWHSVTYESVSGKYLYNRCHLIGFQLTGENANNRNLITGTRTLNIEGMLPFENIVDDYIDATGNHVMYRATPVFSGDNLVADGVLLEGYSVEDSGSGVSFCVYCYNTEPGITIDYATGLSTLTTVSDYNTSTEISGTIYRTPTGKRYHFDASCGGKNSYTISFDEAINSGLTPCQKCVY